MKPSASVTDPNEMLSATFHRAIQSWSVIESFRLFVKHGEQGAQEKLRAEAISEWSTKYGAVFAEFEDEFAHVQVDFILSDARRSTDAASLVFGHSVLDDAVLQCCRASAAADQSRWLELIGQRRVTIDELRRCGSAEIMATNVNELMRGLERDSLLKKLDVLMGRCKPTSDLLRSDRYQYDRAEIERIDSERHNIVHGDGLLSTQSTADSDIEYFQTTTFLVIGLTALSHGLRIEATGKPPFGRE